MSRYRWPIRKGADARSLEVEIKDQSVNLNAVSSVFFRMLAPDGVTLKIDDKAAVVVQVSGPAIVRYDWDPVDLDTDGEHLGFFGWVNADGTRDFAPDPEFIEIPIGEDWK